ncbi:hypothetical protein ACFL08_04415 [Patescibacteria group bacterium]
MRKSTLIKIGNRVILFNIMMLVFVWAFCGFVEFPRAAVSFAHAMILGMIWKGIRLGDALNSDLFFSSNALLAISTIATIYYALLHANQFLHILIQLILFYSCRGIGGAYSGFLVDIMIKEVDKLH